MVIAMRSLALSIGLTALCLVSVAGATQTPPPLQIGKVVSQQEQIRADVMAKNGRYASMPEAKREELLSRQSQLLRMLDGKKTADDLTADQRMRAFNTLEWIEAAINNEDDDRMVCTRERTIGSNRVTRVCRTEAQMREQRERAREEISTRAVCGDASCR